MRCRGREEEWVETNSSMSRQHIEKPRPLYYWVKGLLQGSWNKTDLLAPVNKMVKVSLD